MYQCLDIPVEPFIGSNVSELDMDKTHAMANLYVSTLVFQITTVKHVSKTPFVATARTTIVHTRESVHSGNW